MISTDFILSHRGKNVQIDEIVEEAVQSKPKNLKSSCDKRLAVKWEESVWDRFMKLKKENCVIKALEHEVSKYRIKDWQLVSSSLPKNIFAFCRRGLILALPTNVNMCFWKMANSIYASSAIRHKLNCIQSPCVMLLSKMDVLHGITILSYTHYITIYQHLAVKRTLMCLLICLVMIRRRHSLTAMDQIF